MSQKHAITAFLYDKKGNILSIGKNNYLKTHPLQAFHAKKAGQEERIYLHAEIDAIIRCKDLSIAHSMLIIRRYKDGSPAMAAPCAVCCSALKAAGIVNVRHT